MSNAEAFHAKRNFAAGVSNTDRLAMGEGMTDQEQHCLHQSNRNLFRSISSRISDRGVAILADCGQLRSINATSGKIDREIRERLLCAVCVQICDALTRCYRRSEERRVGKACDSTCSSSGSPYH